MRAANNNIHLSLRFAIWHYFMWINKLRNVSLSYSCSGSSSSHSSRCSVQQDDDLKRWFKTFGCVCTLRLPHPFDASAWRRLSERDVTTTLMAISLQGKSVYFCTYWCLYSLLLFLPTPTDGAGCWPRNPSCIVAFFRSNQYWLSCSRAFLIFALLVPVFFTVAWKHFLCDFDGTERCTHWAKSNKLWNGTFSCWFYQL